MSAGIEAVVEKVGTYTIKQGPCAGKTVAICQLAFKEYASGMAEALAYYKGEKIAGYAKNLQHAPEELRAAMLQEAFREANRIEHDDLPEKTEVDRDTGQSVKLPYGMWWMSFHPEGCLFTCWMAMQKHPSQRTMTIEEAKHMISTMEDINGIAQAVGELSRQRLGNAEAPPAATEGRRERRRRRRGK